MVGAVLTQNTAWSNVDRSLAALKAEDVLEPHALVAMEPERLQELIRPSGFYVNKSKTVQSLSWWYVERCGAAPEGAAAISDAELRAELLGLFGIGGETADDLMLYVFSRRTFVADTYARRTSIAHRTGAVHRTVHDRTSRANCVAASRFVDRLAQPYAVRPEQHLVDDRPLSPRHHRRARCRNCRRARLAALNAGC